MKWEWKSSGGANFIVDLGPDVFLSYLPKSTDTEEEETAIVFQAQPRKNPEEAQAELEKLKEQKAESKEELLDQAFDTMDLIGKVLYGKRKYLTLAGDWREKYEEAFERDGLGGVLAVYEANREQHQTKWDQLMTKLGIGDDE